jgi:hypothetical protein
MGLRQDVVFKTLIFFALPLFFSCGAPKMDIESEEGRNAIIDATNLALTQGQCDLAISLIDPLYNSKYTNNNVRLLYASAQGCMASVNYFGLISDLPTASISAGGIWTTLTQFFPYTDLPGLNAGWRGIESLLACINFPDSVASSYRFNSNTDNMGSYLVDDRTDDSSSYLIFMTMAVIGRTQNRNGAPNSSYHKTQNLPWTTAAAMTTEGFQYASAIVNMIDAIHASAGQASGSIQSTLNLIDNVYQNVLKLACENGCTNQALTGCNLSAGSCTATGSFCPLELRWGGNATNLTTDKATCAAAGVVNFINSDPILGWQ